MINNYIKSIIIMILMLIISSSKVAIAEVITYCGKSFDDITMNNSLDSLEKKMQAWSLFEKECGDVHDIYLIDLFLGYKSIKEAKETFGKNY